MYLREEGGYHFKTSLHAFQLIPLIRKGEEETIKSEIECCCYFFMAQQG